MKLSNQNIVVSIFRKKVKGGEQLFLTEDAKFLKNTTEKHLLETFKLLFRFVIRHQISPTFTTNKDKSNLTAGVDA